jgi:hypothetical protein
MGRFVNLGEPEVVAQESEDIDMGKNEKWEKRPIVIVSGEMEPEDVRELNKLMKYVFGLNYQVLVCDSNTTIKQPE